MYEVSLEQRQFMLSMAVNSEISQGGRVVAPFAFHVPVVAL
ncbi:hypothetical protein [Nocardia sp. IFM 10818]